MHQVTGMPKPFPEQSAIQLQALLLGVAAAQHNWPRGNGQLSDGGRAVQRFPTETPATPGTPRTPRAALPALRARRTCAWLDAKSRSRSSAWLENQDASKPCSTGSLGKMGSGPAPIWGPRRAVLAQRDASYCKDSGDDAASFAQQRAGPNPCKIWLKQNAAHVLEGSGAPGSRQGPQQ